MKLLFGFPGWGWKMYGFASFKPGRMWFFGFSKQLDGKACAAMKDERIKELEVDAARYRWIRERPDVIDWDSFPFAAGYEHPDDAIDHPHLMLDASIDAAMKEETE